MTLAFSRLLVFAIAIMGANVCIGSDPIPSVGRIDDFSMPSTDDRAVSLSRDPSVEFHVLCFLGTECPLARIYGPRLQKMSAEYAARGVRFIGINSNVQDSMDELKDYVQQHAITFPVAKDYDRQVALQAGATRTPEVFVIDRSGAIRYQGRIDDQYQPGIARSAATRHDLRNAIEELIAGKPVTQARTTAVGCLISLPRSVSSKSDVTFCNQVIQVLHKHCVECHREGEIGPFALDEYDEVVGWADMALEVIEQGRMPPWHANPEYGSFANARHMPEHDKQTLRRWVEAGMPYGDAKQLPAKPQNVQGWRFSDAPHAVFQISDKPFQIPAEGTVEYQYFVVDPGFREDKWVRAAQVIPGNNSVVHHCIAFTRPPDGADFRDFGMLSAYVPGQVRGELPDGYAQRIAAGSRIVFQMHYTPTGKPEQDITRLGLIFADPKQVTHEVIALGGIEHEFEVPPGAANYAVDGSIGWFPKNGLLLSIMPHMHLRGKSFEFRIESEGKATKLLDVPAYDFNWQHNYQLSSPLPLDQVDHLSFSAVFDNSDDNPTNPDASQYVTWGDQTWQEMAVTFISVARPRVPDTATTNPEKSKSDRRRRTEQKASWDRQAKEFADRYIARFDANGDQHLTSLELPDSVRMFSFWDFDHNNDTRLSHDEIEAEAYSRLQRSSSQRSSSQRENGIIVLNRFGLLADWIIDHRWLTLFLLVVWTVVMAIGHYDPQLLLPEPPPPPRDVAEASGGDGFNQAPSGPVPSVAPVRVASGDVIVVAQSDNFFSPDGAEAIRNVVDALESLDQVDSILWMDRAPMLNLFGLSEPILPKPNASATRFEAARQRALSHPLVGGQLLSPDAKTLLLMVNIDWLYITQDSDCTDLLRDTAIAAAAKFPGVAMTFQVTGEVPIRVSRASSNRANEIKYQAIGYSIALVVAFVLFRGLSSVLIVALAPTFGVFWTLGLLHFMGFDDNPFNSVIVPVLLCMVGFTDGVHMMVQIRRHRASGMTATDAARISIREVGLACWLTSLTTAIGFGSLALAHHEVVREFGYCCVIGVLMTFISVITIIPLACASPLGSRVHAGYGRNLVDKNLSKISVVIDFVLSRARGFSVAAIAITICLALLTLQLRPDERLTSNLASSSEPVVALAHIDKAFGGMETAEVLARWHSDVQADDGEIATVVSKIDDALRNEPLVGHPLSMVSLIDALPGEGDPSTRMSLLELLPPPLKRAYYTPERRFAQVRFRLQDIGIAAYGPVFERVENELTAIETAHPNFRLELTGGAVWRWRNLYQIVMDLAFSLGTASIIIFGVLTIVYRSIRLGLISIVPNIFPLASTGFLLLAVGQNLEIVSVCAFTVCLGIAVDDTIHFLTRYQEIEKRTGDRRFAIRKAFIGVGTALIMTTIVLIIGFSAALLSDARDHRIFAMMGILTIGSALFGDLVFLPALLLRYGGKDAKHAALD